jgi:hypothetical protein
MISLGTGIKKGLTELWLHYLWKEDRFSQQCLRTDDAKTIQVLFPGWYNRGWGPDFRDARILIGEDELFGDVELHIEESAWKDHHHDQDSTYNRVILHVFLERGRRPAINHFGQIVPALCLGDAAYRRFWRAETNRPVEVVRDLPGACGLSLIPAQYPRLRSLIFQAAEQRMMQKADVFDELLRDTAEKEWEQVLYVSLCRSIGYSAYDETLVQLAQTYPYAEILGLLQKQHRQNRIEVLGRWLGFTGLLDSVSSGQVNDSLRREWAAMRQFWQDIGGVSLMNPIRPKTSSRPLNHPLRRLLGLYYHLERIQFQGLLKSWLKFVQDSESQLHGAPAPGKRLQQLMADLFPQPDWEPLNRLLSADSTTPLPVKARLIGEKRQRVILANTIIPFFLSWSRRIGDKRLEKTLLALFLVLPAEGRNSKTRFMEQRLLKGQIGFKVKKNLSYHQGLIQLHDDCCRSFYEGCDRCSLMQLLNQDRNLGSENVRRMRPNPNTGSAITTEATSG